MSAIKRLKLENMPNKIEPASEGQNQTREAFSYKWSRRETYESEEVKNFSRDWLLERYCNNDPALLSKWLEGEKKIILDAGCGAGHSALLFFADHLRNHDYLGVDISDSVLIAQKKFAESNCPGDFLQCNLLDLPLPVESVDIIFSEGVLHHTDNTESAIKYLSTKLKPGGRFLFYVYAKKAVIREFTDDHIRNKLSSLSDEEAWSALEPLTKLGIALGKMDIDIEIPEDIPLLGITRGKTSLQRFFYWNICKTYFRPEFSLDEMNHCNYDWFRPANCHRHTPEEIKKWVEEAGLKIERMNVQEAGITVVALK